jgi:hypothetical protein
MDNLANLALALRSGQKSKIMKAFIAVLREGKPIPTEAMHIMADFFEGKTDGRGRPKKQTVTAHWERQYLVRRVDRWSGVFEKRLKARAPRREAVTKVAAEYDRSAATIKRAYGDAKRHASILTPDWQVARVMRDFALGPFNRGKQ